jgi:peptidoglycan/xylan/chitin deacetylase (PgdA/CDA1 family)
MLRLLLLLGFVLPVNAADHAVILVYHHVDASTPRSTSVTPDRFDAHLRTLEDGGFSVVSLDSVFAAVTSGESVPDKSVVITFDDAYESVYTTAWPSLAQRGWPFTIFVSTYSVEQGYRPYMSWEQITEMAAAGVGIGNHGHLHDHALHPAPGESADERLARFKRNIEDAEQLMQQRIALKPTVFAYPYGEYDLATEAVVADLGLNGVSQQSGVFYSGDRSTSAPRFPIATGTDSDQAFNLRINALPLPVQLIEPVRVVKPGTRPDLRFRLPIETAPLNCFVNGEASPPVNNRGTFTVSTPKPLPVGRSKTTCTARHESGAYRWFSHLWVAKEG